MVAARGDVPRDETVTDWPTDAAAAYLAGKRDGWNLGVRAGWQAASRAMNNAIAAAVAPLPETAGAVVRRLVRGFHETAPSAGSAGRQDANGAGSVRSDDWPGIEALSASERAAAYCRILGSWDRP